MTDKQDKCEDCVVYLYRTWDYGNAETMSRYREEISDGYTIHCSDKFTYCPQCGHKIDWGE